MRYLDGFNGGLSGSQPIGGHGETATRRLLFFFTASPSLRFTASLRLGVSASFSSTDPGRVEGCHFIVDLDCSFNYLHGQGGAGTFTQPQIKVEYGADT